MSDARASMSWRRALVAMAIVLPFVALLNFGLRIDADPRGSVPSPGGRMAADFSLERMDGQGTVRLSQQRGRIVVLNFWASWCPPCRDEHPELIRLANAYAADSVQFYGMLYNDSEANARRFLTELGEVPYPTLLPGAQHTGIDYGVTGPPETFVIGRDGRIAYKQIGPLSRTDLRITQVLDSLLGRS
jgi:cytochrome c biogenesis protein CcmG, thiol:disulfide interchange protein DsbE